MITREIFQSYIDCKYKAFLKQSSEAVPSEPNQYAALVERLDAEYRTSALEELFPNAELTVDGEPTHAAPPMTAGADVILLASVTNQHIHAIVDALERVRGKSNFGFFHYQPILTVRSSTVSSNDKLMLGFLGVVLADVQGRVPQFGKVVFGNNKKPLRVRLAKAITRARKIVEMLVSDKEEPTLRLNRHCKVCSFQKRCYEKAKGKDDLSLLSRISQKEVESLNKRGIYTVTQLSHKFKPQRRHKSLEQKKKPHSNSLQSLAIREGKIHVYNCAQIPKSNIELFLDVECDMDREFYYLIGLKVRQGDSETLEDRQFWADRPEQEAFILHRFLDMVRPLADFKLFHFGSFESRFIKTMAKRLDLENDGVVRRILAASVNIVEYTYSSIYFPTYSNDLKSLASFLGFRWADPAASGLQSIVWRDRWEELKDKELKKTLLQYNKDDVDALVLLTDYIRKITSTGLEKAEGGEIVNAEALGNQQPIRWGPIKFVSPEMREINDCAYYDYQRDRVYFRTERKRRSSASKRRTKKRRFPKINQTIIIECRKCPSCKATDIEQKSRSKRLAVDLKFSDGGVKRWVTKYSSWCYHCNRCKIQFTPTRYRPKSRQRMRLAYGHGLQSWIIFQHLVNNQSFSTIAEDLVELFGINIGRSPINWTKSEMFRKYQPTYDEIKEQLLTSNVLVVDEAKMKLHDATGYAWVFANSKNVLFEYRETRDGEFLKGFLKGFKGVLVSDFYAAYDSIPCAQQKCLIHWLFVPFRGDFEGNFLM